MKSLFKICTPLLATVLLASCGGGGGDGHGATTPPDSGRLMVTATTQNLPLNTFGVSPQLGGPFTTEVTIYVRHHDGTLVNEIDHVNVSISPVESATFSTLDDPETDDINEFLLRLGYAPVDAEAGTATVFVTSNGRAGTAVLTVTADDVNGLSFQSETLEFEIGNVAAELPSAVSLGADSTSVYLPGSGGDSTALITAFVSDAGNQPVPDPADGNSAHNNVRFEVVGDAANGSLSGNAASGDGVNGQVIEVRTTNGIANASFTAGSAQGPVTIRATADAADNNVDNGIDSPVVSTITVIVSDGKLYNLEITSPLFAPGLPGIEINSLPVSEDVEGPVASGSVPPNPDATLSLVVSVLATDRQGNPVVPGTAIRFGSVDEPVAPYDEAGGGNYFQLSGYDGNPAEGGNLFTAPGGHFLTAGGGAGPGDALVVFGEAVQGNADLESAVTVQSVNSQTSLSVAPTFNINDTTGSSVDYGAVLPYLIGRSAHGNITATATTNELGVASAALTYTVNSVGHAAAIWAQGNGAHRITDALTLTYPGVAPAILTAVPNPIPGNTDTEVTVCLTGALGIPLRGFPVAFSFQLNGGSGSVDGHAGAGLLDHYTGSNGCAIAEVSTSGLGASPADGNSGVLTFNSAGATAAVDILVDVAFLSGSGELCGTDGDPGDPGTVPPTPATPANPAQIVITAYSNAGVPVSGVNITATCDGGVTITPGSAITNGAGRANFQAIAPDAAQGTCTFTSDNGRSVSVGVQGSGGSFSPTCPI